MIKIVVTITDTGLAANVGGDPDRKSAIIEIPTKNIPPLLTRYIDRKNKSWETVSFSLLDEDL